MVIKVDFDLTMSILSHNIYRLFAFDLERYSHMTSQSLYEKFIATSADIKIEDKEIIVAIKKEKKFAINP